MALLVPLTKTNFKYNQDGYSVGKKKGRRNFQTIHFKEREEMENKDYDIRIYTDKSTVLCKDLKDRKKRFKILSSSDVIRLGSDYTSYCLVLLN